MSNRYPEGHNVGLGMVPHRKSCHCDECEIERLRDKLRGTEARLAEAERDADQLLKERDHAEDMADKLADAVATLLGVEIGEHSSGNCPWTTALEAFEERPTGSASVLNNEGDDK